MMSLFYRCIPVFIVVLSGCRGTVEEQESGGQESRDAVPGLEVTVRGVMVIFEGSATEVAVSLVNRRSEPVILSGLGGKATLTVSSGAVLPVHEISVGVAKPVVVPGKGSLETSLLFEGAGADATRLRLLEADVRVH